MSIFMMILQYGCNSIVSEKLVTQSYLNAISSNVLHYIQKVGKKEGMQRPGKRPGKNKP